jgi:hypothetical protein
MRVLAHAHSLWSHDGTLSLTNWVELARQIRCDVILLSEHEETGWTPDRYTDYVAACIAASTSDVKLIPGIEFSQDGFHVLCYGLQQFPPRPSSAAQLAVAIHSQGRWLCLAHPGKYRWQYPTSLLAAVDAVEVWNSKWIYDGTLGPHPNSLKLARGKALFVGQDVHKQKHLSPLYLQTATPDVLTDLLAGRYQIMLGDRCSPPETLRSNLVLGLAQRCRTRILKPTLAAYRLMRKTVVGRLIQK